MQIELQPGKVSTYTFCFYWVVIRLHEIKLNKLDGVIK